ncbi:MAG: aldehyde dehydrogenase family protein [Clostridia bacterium]|nr:aldehyde dehydrogenase family protein [Clostridia bacterium]
MILYKGQIYETNQNAALLQTLKADANETLLNKSIDRGKLISAADLIAGKIKSGEYNYLLEQTDIDGIEEYVDRAAEMLKRENLLLNLKASLPALVELPEIETYIAPVGVLFHIAAGNVDVLPAYSVLCGLLCGNVNILKLPSQDNGITIKILSELIKIMPELSDFIYVFDTPSSDVGSMLKMAEAADKVVVWGGDEAVTAVRKMLPANIGIVEWGHRISFAYIDADYEKYPDKLQGLAEHIIKTSQLFCSSCQRIYINSDKEEDAEKFCRYFLPYLQAARNKRPLKDIGAAAEQTLIKYAEDIERSINNEYKNEKKYSGEGCALTVKTDKELQISGFFGVCDVSALPLDQLFGVLRCKKGYLQTACVIADEQTAEAAEDIMVRAGVNRITSPAKMSDTFIGEAHDGAPELYNYVRIINKEV